jgi:Domain of unknown function (DUF2382)
MTWSEEQVHAGMEKVTAAKARLRKWVETEDVHAKAPVAKESVPVAGVRLTKETVQDVDRVSEQIRKERIQAESDVDLT